MASLLGRVGLACPAGGRTSAATLRAGRRVCVAAAPKEPVKVFFFDPEDPERVQSIEAVPTSVSGLVAPGTDPVLLQQEVLNSLDELQDQLMREQQAREQYKALLQQQLEQQLERQRSQLEMQQSEIVCQMADAQEELLKQVATREQELSALAAERDSLQQTSLALQKELNDKLVLFDGGKGGGGDSKSLAIQQQLLSQLESERERAGRFAMYENMYREMRFKSEELLGELGELHQLVASKDAELSQAYKLMQMAAAERALLRRTITRQQEEAQRLMQLLVDGQLLANPTQAKALIADASASDSMDPPTGASADALGDPSLASSSSYSATGGGMPGAAQPHAPGWGPGEGEARMAVDGVEVGEALERALEAVEQGGSLLADSSLTSASSYEFNTYGAGSVAAPAPVSATSAASGPADSSSSSNGNGNGNGVAAPMVSGAPAVTAATSNGHVGSNGNGVVGNGNGNGNGNAVGGFNFGGLLGFGRMGNSAGDQQRQAQQQQSR